MLKTQICVTRPQCVNILNCVKTKNKREFGLKFFKKNYWNNRFHPAFSYTLHPLHRPSISSLNICGRCKL